VSDFDLINGQSFTLDLYSLSLLKGKCLIFSLVWLIPFLAFGQLSSTVHFSVKDGLPSSTVYSVAQDSLGFMWIGTEAGLARFDGSKFKIFTTQDGLPDNEVLGVIFDSGTNRLWIITYSRSACYYRNGKFYTSKNDSSLALIRCESGEFIAGNLQPGLGVFLENGSSIYRCAHDSITKISISSKKVDIRCIKQWSDSSVDVIVGIKGMLRHTSKQDIDYSVFCCDTAMGRGKWIGDLCYIFRIGKIDIYDRLKNGDYRYKGQIILGGEKKGVNIIIRNSEYVISVTNVGVYTVDTALRDLPRRIWSGKSNDIDVDIDGNIWVTSNDDGLFVIRNRVAQNYLLGNDRTHDNLTTLYFEKPDKLYCGNSDGELFLWQANGVTEIKTRLGFGNEKMRGITSYDNYLFVISSAAISYFSRAADAVIIPHWGDHTRSKIKFWGGGQKCILNLRDGQTILVGLLSNVGEFKTKTKQYREVSVNKRIIAMAQHPDGRVICGSLDGLYWYTGDTLHPIIKVDPELSGRVTSLCFSQDTLLWIGTPSDGIIVYDGRKIIAHINSAKYLGYHGAMCRQVVVGRRNEMWVATNSGINKIRYHLKDSFEIDNVTPLNMADGLLSDDVNDIAVNDSLIFVATSHGLTVLNENQMMDIGAVPIYISSIKINDRDSAIHDAKYSLTYTQNNLKIEYVGVSLPSSGYLRYQYRLLGSGNDKWVTTDNTSIEFRSLSAGDYVFEAVVLDKFGNKSRKIARVTFEITPAFYMTVWFWAIVFVVLMSIGFYIIRARFRAQERQFKKEQEFNNKIIELEQQALKAQMNPHFIFNCLTAVQHFVNKEDLYSANMYLSNFARLIRKTLDLSGEQYISLDKEVAYLQNYIQLEKMRFQEKFQYTVNVAEDIDQYAVQIPPMLLQPIIENAIRHGLRNMDTDTGMLRVDFRQEAKRLICTIDDNGIGMKKAAELKTTMHVEYQSKGMSLTMSRIQAINMISDKKITIDIKDKYDNNEADGTLVTLNFEQ
jgi:hypothetical protein